MNVRSLLGSRGNPGYGGTALSSPRERGDLEASAPHSEAWTTVEKAYSQIEKESLGFYSGVVANRMYLLGTKFEAVVDHKPLLPLYNKVTRPKQARVDRHRMSLRPKLQECQGYSN